MIYTIEKGKQRIKAKLNLMGVSRPNREYLNTEHDADGRSSKHYKTKEVYVDAIHGKIGACSGDRTTQRTMTLRNNKNW